MKKSADVYAHMAHLVEALQTIAKWGSSTFPEATSGGEVVSYAHAYGSNGERDYMRHIALEALHGIGRTPPGVSVHVFEPPNRCGHCGEYVTVHTCEYSKHGERASESIATAVKAAYLRLQRPGMPDDALCSHFGINIENNADARVQLSARGNWTLVTIYDRHHHRLPQKVHRQRTALVAAWMGNQIVEEWNGSEGHDGISIVLDAPAPDSLARAQLNYELHSKTMPRDAGVDARYAAFDEWYGSGA